MELRVIPNTCQNNIWFFYTFVILRVILNTKDRTWNLIPNVCNLESDTKHVCNQGWLSKMVRGFMGVSFGFVGGSTSSAIAGSRRPLQGLSNSTVVIGVIFDSCHSLKKSENTLTHFNLDPSRGYLTATSIDPLGFCIIICYDYSFAPGQQNTKHAAKWSKYQWVKIKKNSPIKNQKKIPELKIFQKFNR